MNLTETLPALATCGLDLRCLQTIGFPRTAAEIVTICVVLVSPLLIPPIKDILSNMIRHHPAAALFLLAGAAVYIYTAYVVALAVCLVTLVTYICVQVLGKTTLCKTRWPHLAHRLSNGSAWWYILPLGCALFVIAVAVEHFRHEALLDSNRKADANVTVAFTLPGEIASRGRVELSSFDRDDLPKKLRNYLQTVFQELKSKVIILPPPSIEPDLFTKLRKIFPPEHDNHDTVAERLHRLGRVNGTPVDFVIGTELTVVSTHVESSVKILRLLRPTRHHPHPELDPAGKFRLNLPAHRLSHAALVATAGLAILFADQHPALTTDEKAGLWKALNKKFQTHHWDQHKGVGGNGKRKLPASDCLHLECVEQWVDEYVDILRAQTTAPQKNAFNSEVNRVLTRLRLSWEPNRRMQ